LKDLAELPAAYRKRIEKLVFEEFPEMSSLSDKLDIRKIQGYENYYRIRIGNYTDFPITFPPRSRQL
jgi:mRNA interferase RelE/StbE